MFYHFAHNQYEYVTMVAACLLREVFRATLLYFVLKAVVQDFFRLLEC